MSNMGTYANKYVKPVTPNVNLKSRPFTAPAENPMQGQVQTPVRKPAQGIINPGDIRSKVENKPLDIPGFLQKK